MFNKKRNLQLYLGLIIFSFISFTTVANATSFTERLAEIGVNIQSLSQKQSISRYEITRLLNAVNCEDCVQAPERMRNQYTVNFWNEFKNIDGNYFGDINFEGGVWNKKSYYYCVAYVGDNNLMSGYPLTSNTCKGNFCGQQSVTASEFYQIVLNIIQDQIREKYKIDWAKVKSRTKKGIKNSDKKMSVFTETDITAIENANSKLNYANTNDEFQAWLKYCMYNLSECEFQSFGKIGAGFWPVSELNILYKEGIITEQEAEETAEFKPINGNNVLRIFENVHDDYTSCNFNVDYDCDGIPNGEDNCPYDFNPNQIDLDGDGIGNVCDNDIDGDGIVNPIGIVDDDDNIIISIWDNNLDQKPLGNRDSGFGFFINVDSINGGLNRTVSFTPVSDGNIDTILWDFGDGTKQTTTGKNKVIHTYKSTDTFIIKATATSKNNVKAFALSKIFISIPENESYSLTISPKTVTKNGSIEYTFVPSYVGDFDSITRTVNDTNKENKSPSEAYKFTKSGSGNYVVMAQGYKNGELEAIAMLTINQAKSPAFATILIQPGNLREDSTITTNLTNIAKNKIKYISINWGDGSTKSENKLTQTFNYTTPGKKTVQENIVLFDGTVLYAIGTFTVQSPLTKQSYAVNISNDILSYEQNETLNLGINLYPRNQLILSLFTNYQPGISTIEQNINLHKVSLNHAYSTAGSKTLTNSVAVNKCVSLMNQGTLHIKSKDICLTALKEGTLSQYKCDLDQDGIPDICDDDIDGDGIPNLIGIITKENSDCSITTENISKDILKKQLGVCSLDNCPFVVNKNQTDLNNNGIGEDCEAAILNLLSAEDINIKEGESASLVNDKDQDGVIDSLDECINVPGNMANGCPADYTQDCGSHSTCGNNKLDPGENCLNCPEDAGSCCGNGILDFRETCLTCPQDCGPESKKCGNGVIDEDETCLTCPEDVGTCTARCGNGKVEDPENCLNCPEDVGTCTTHCGDGEIQIGETFENCPQDFHEKSVCGNGKVEEGEQCDHGNKNGNDKQCTTMCTIYDPNHPKCGNGIIDDGETCLTCPIDFDYRCDDGGYGKCGDNIIQGNENCNNCPQDVGTCTIHCGDNVIQDGETHDICDDDIPEPNVCGNGKIEKGEQCDDGKDNGKNNKCTIKCTKYNPNKPNCGNGIIDDGEDCNTCPVDLGDRCKDYPHCGDGKIDDGEDCNTCPQDVGACTARCGDGIIQDAENCRNCSKDVGTCTIHCGDNVIQDGETHDICDDDIPEPNVCGNGKIEKGEQCDDGKDNGKNNKCTIKCTKYNPNKPNCGNGIIDDGENCNTCPVDLGDRCKDYPHCGDGKIDDGEDCNTCPQDVGACTARCGDGIIQDAENCRNCSKDVGTCTIHCGDNIIQDGETHDICDDDIPEPNVCGNGKIEKGEQCDDGKDNGKNNKCTIKCTKYNPNKPNCGNGIIDDGENCNTCPVDLGDRCKDDGNKNGDESAVCGNGILETGEKCDPKDSQKKNWGTNGCSNTCIPQGSVLCNPTYNGKRLLTLTSTSELCKLGQPGSFSLDNAGNIWTWICKDGQISATCSAFKSYCGDGILDEGENCKNCSKDAKDICIDDGDDNCVCGDGIQCEGEKCDNCLQDIEDKSKCIAPGDDKKNKCGNSIVEYGEECDLGERNGLEGEKCDTSCKLIKDVSSCGNGKKDEGEDCNNCPEDFGWCIDNSNCVSCPCEYAEMANNLIKGDVVRARLWDKTERVFYRYSNIVSISNYLK